MLVSFDVSFCILLTESELLKKVKDVLVDWYVGDTDNDAKVEQIF